MKKTQIDGIQTGDPDYIADVSTLELISTSYGERNGEALLGIYTYAQAEEANDFFYSMDHKGMFAFDRISAAQFIHGLARRFGWRVDGVPIEQRGQKVMRDNGWTKRKED